MTPRPTSLIQSRPTTPRWAVAAFYAVVAVACASEEPSDGACDLAALVPGLSDVGSGPRSNAMAEAMGLVCEDGVATSEAVHAALDADLVRIWALDPRMRLDGTGRTEGVAPLRSEHLSIAMLVAHGEPALEARRKLATGCAARLTAALGGVVTERTFAGNPVTEVSFPSRLNERVLVASYARVGVLFERGNIGVGDGSRASYREGAQGREFLFGLRWGDCPSGCGLERTFWWRVDGDRAELLGEWGDPFEATSPGSQPRTDPPGSFEPEGFECRKCADGRASRLSAEGLCDDGVDNDCDGVTDCEDSDCAAAPICVDEICDDQLDNDGDGATDCDDSDCAFDPACGGAAACGAPGDIATLEGWSRGPEDGLALISTIDRFSGSCANDAAAAERCLEDLMSQLGLSPACRSCLVAGGVCIVSRCPFQGVTDGEHAACVADSCGSALTACAGD